MAKTKTRTKNPYWQKLSWHAPRRCWKKYRDGKTYYLGNRGVTRSDRTSHDEALREWEQIVATIEDRTQKRVKSLGYDPRPHGYNLEDAEQMDAVFAITQEAQPDTSSSDTIGGTVADFLTYFQALSRTGSRTENTYYSLKPRLEGFRDWLSIGASTDNLNAATLAKYHLHLLERIGEKKMSPQYAHDHLRAAKQLIRWAWQNEIIENLPRNLDTLRIDIPLQTPKVLAPSTVRRLLAAATRNRPRLYLSLALLCGMTARDMAALKHSELDLKTGRLTRKRSKTQRHENVPTVSYRLPDPVVQLLRAEMTKGRGDDLVLLTTTNMPLVHGHRNDSVKATFVRLLDQVNNQIEAEAEERRKRGEKKVKADTIAASMKVMRSTSATLLDHHERFKAVTSLWLGHAPLSIKERHYTTGDQRLLDQAVGWLAGEYGLDQGRAVS